MNDLPRLILALTVLVAVSGTVWIALTRATGLQEAAIAVISSILGACITYLALTDKSSR